MNKATLQKWSFNKERIFDYVKKFSFPRLPGTEGERKAVDLTVKTFEEIGFNKSQIEEEPFEFSDFYSTTLIKLIMMVNLTFILILVLFIYIYPIINFVIIGVMVLLVVLIVRGLRHPEREDQFWAQYFGKTIQATNVFVNITAKRLPIEKAGNIIVSAHLDSKSQTFKTSWRMVLYRVWLFSSILFGGFYIGIILQNLGIFQLEILILNIIILILVVLISLSNILLMFLNTHNESPGALDNASGMAIVFELASYFKLTTPLDNFNLWFCQFSGEELGTMGSRVFTNNHEDQFVKNEVFQINLDMVSSAKHKKKKNRVQYLKSYGILPRRKISPLLGNYLKKAALEENLKICGFHLSTGAHSDTVPFHLRKYNAVDICTRAAAKFTHNKVDTPDKVDPRVLLETCVIVRKAILMLDKDYTILCKKRKVGKEE
ncbi:MAG: M28 family metallopeptidase [Promethearchaeota archaeon]